MSEQDTHLLRGCETIGSSGKEVLKVLTDITRHYQYFAPGVTRVEILTPGLEFGQGFSWSETRSVLYLRETCIFKVIKFEEASLRYKLCMEDGFNKVLYTFQVSSMSPNFCKVSYEVECRARHMGDSKVDQPSARLARMMAKQDGLLVQRLKAHIESANPVICC